MVEEDSQSEPNKLLLVSSKEANLRMIINVFRMPIYNRQYAVHVHTDEILLELQVGIYHLDKRTKKSPLAVCFTK